MARNYGRNSMIGKTYDIEAVEQGNKHNSSFILLEDKYRPAIEDSIYARLLNFELVHETEQPKEKTSNFEIQDKREQDALKTEVLASMLIDEYYETGIVNPSENFFKTWHSQDNIGAMNALSSLFYKNYSMNTKNVNVLVGILHILSHMAYEEANPLGCLIALSALSHKNLEIKEFALKCYENWGTSGNLEVISKLRACDFAVPWLREYADAVIEELERCL